MRILSGDPGKVNFALCVLEIKGNKLEVLGTRMFNKPIQSLKVDMREQVEEFVEEIDSLWEQYGPFDGCCFERFQSRGLGGDTIEAISLMLGVLSTWCSVQNVPIRLITASQWKNMFNRTMCLKDLYKENKLTSKKSAKAIHEFDAMLIGLYMFGLMKDVNAFGKVDKIMPTLMPKFLAAPNL